MSRGPASSSPQAYALYPPPSLPINPSEIHANLVLPRGSAGGRPYTVINAVSTLDGRAALEGKSSTIGSAADRRIMRNIRAAFDAVLVGAGTLRAEDVDLTVPEDLASRRRNKGHRCQLIPIILMGNSQLPKDRKVYRLKNLVIMGPRVEQEHLPAGTAFRVLPDPECGSGRVDVREALRLLGEEFGVGRLLVEGGPAVNYSFLSGDHVDEIFLTIAPGISGRGNAPSIISGPETLPGGVRKAGLISVHAVTGGELYLRYRLR